MKGEREDVLARLIQLAVRNSEFAGKVPRSFGYNQRRMYALTLARLGRIQESWVFIKGLASKPLKSELLRQVFKQYELYIGEDKKIDRFELLLKLEMIEAARFYATAYNSWESSLWYLAIYRHTHDRGDIKKAKKLLMSSDLLLPGFARMKVLLEIALETKHPDDLRSVIKYFAFHGRCFDLEDSLVYWQMWRRISGDPEATKNIRRIQACMRRQKKAKERELVLYRQTFFGLLDWYEEAKNVDHLQSAVNMIFNQDDPERRAEMILRAIGAIDATPNVVGDVGEVW